MAMLTRQSQKKTQGDTPSTPQKKAQIDSPSTHPSTFASMAQKILNGFTPETPSVSKATRVSKKRIRGSACSRCRKKKIKCTHGIPSNSGSSHKRTASTATSSSTISHPVPNLNEATVGGIKNLNEIKIKIKTEAETDICASTAIYPTASSNDSSSSSSNDLESHQNIAGSGDTQTSLDSSSSTPLRSSVRNSARRSGNLELTQTRVNGSGVSPVNNSDLDITSYDMDSFNEAIASMKEATEKIMESARKVNRTCIQWMGTRELHKWNMNH